MPSNNEPRVIVALDFDNERDALALASRLDPSRCAVKVGSELFTTAGPGPVRDLVARGFNVFLDLKFHDIPNTVAHACAAATRLGVWMMNVHAAGGRAMLGAASDSVRSTAAAMGRVAPRLIAVTVLTSLADDDLRDIGQTDTASAQALRLAQLTRDCGLDGVVCSAVEARAMRERFGTSFTLVTPGIRPSGSAVDDQSRIATPERAVANGADFLVVGRPITRAPDPIGVVAQINRAIGVVR